MYFDNSAKCIAAKWLVKRCVLPSRNRMIPLVCSREKSCQRLKQQTLLERACQKGKRSSAESRQHLRLFKFVELEQSFHPEKNLASARRLPDLEKLCSAFPFSHRSIHLDH